MAAIIISGLVGAGTEFAWHGLTCRGVVGATIGLAAGALAGYMVETADGIDEFKRMAGISLFVNAVCSRVITFFAFQLTLVGSLALIGVSVATFYSAYSSENAGIIKLCSVIVGAVGVELTAAVALKLLPHGAAVASMGLGFAGTGIAIIVGTALRYATQKSRRIDS